jgi:hypothetical protein
MGANLEVDISDLSDDAVRRLLRDAIKQQSVNSMPAGKRGKAKKEMEECDCCGKPACDCECEDEDDNDAMVEMDRSATGGKANLPGVTSDDLPRGMNMKKYANKGKKRGNDIK